MNRRRGGNDIMRRRASGTTPPRARKGLCAPSGEGSVSHLSAVRHSLFRVRPRETCHRSPVKGQRLSSLNLGSSRLRCSSAQERTLSSVPCATASPFRSRSKPTGNLQRFSACADHSSANGWPKRDDQHPVLAAQIAQTLCKHSEQKGRRARHQPNLTVWRFCHGANCRTCQASSR
jgi:hypothetical protein